MRKFREGAKSRRSVGSLGHSKFNLRLFQHGAPHSRERRNDSRIFDLEAGKEGEVDEREDRRGRIA